MQILNFPNNNFPHFNIEKKNYQEEVFEFRFNKMK